MMNKASGAVFLHLFFLFGLSAITQAWAQTANPTQRQLSTPESAPHLAPIPPLPADVPEIGAEVWITPDTTTDQMDLWKGILSRSENCYHLGGGLLHSCYTKPSYERRAGEGNRTLVCSLEGYRSTIELRPHV